MPAGTDVNYLRVSITDRCNLRCVYCNPLGDDGCADRGEMLDFDEIQRVVGLCVASGITKVRLTGGEPLMREHVVDLVRRLASLAGMEDLSLTTNGIWLHEMAAELKRAGLMRVNISLDAAERRCYRQITGADMLERVIDGMHAALAVGLTPVKVNCVVLRDINLAQVTTLAEMSLCLPVAVRFIEYSPTGRSTGTASWYVPNGEVRARIEARVGPLLPAAGQDASGPAVYFRAADAAGAIGFISGRSSTFCDACSRLRLTCDGRFKACLHAAQCYDVKRLLRDGAEDAVVLDLIGRVLGEKGRYTRLDSTVADFSMQHIGG